MLRRLTPTYFIAVRYSAFIPVSAKNQHNINANQIKFMTMRNFKFILIPLYLFLIGLGAAFPMGDFAGNDITSDVDGGAQTGLDLNFNYVYSFSENGLGLFGGLDICYNGLRGDVKSSVKKLYESMGIHGADYNFYSYYNIPVSAGFIYTQKVKEGLSLFTNLGLAADIMKMSDMVISLNGQEITVETKPDIKMGFKISCGLIENKTTVSINYMGLGKHDLKATVSSGSNSQKIEGKQKVGILTITLGFKI